MPTPIHLVGNLTDDPELRFTASGTAVVKFSVALNRQRKNERGEWEDVGTDFHRVTAWEHLAENIAATLQKGARVIVVGDLRQDHWKDEKSGENRSAWSVHAFAVGPDLKFATATVNKTARAAAGQAPPDDPWNTASKQRPAEPAAAGAGHLPGQWPTPQAGYSAEPPF